LNHLNRLWRFFLLRIKTQITNHQQFRPQRTITTKGITMTITEIANKYPRNWNHPEIVAQLEAAECMRSLTKEQVQKEGSDRAFEKAMDALDAYKSDLSYPYRRKLALKAADHAFKNWSYLN